MPARILVIEDNAVNLELMAYLLAAAGHEVLEARDGAAGLEAARRESPDVILCDIHMDGLDGYEVAKRIKTDPALARVPLIAVTALVMPMDRSRILQAGFDGYIPKPISPQTVVQQIERYLPKKLHGTGEGGGKRRPVAAAFDEGGGKTVLVVDDRPANRDLLASILRYGGHAVLTAADGEEALRILHEERPDLVIADVLMPRMDGYELVRRLRTDPALSGTQVIFCSAHYLDERALSLARRCGVYHVVTKPVDPAEILKTVDAALGMRTVDLAASPDGGFDRAHLGLVTDMLSRKVGELDGINARLTALVELGHGLALERDSLRALERVCAAARRILDVRHACLGLVDPETGELARCVADGLAQGAPARLRELTEEACVFRRVAAGDRPIRMLDLETGLPPGARAAWPGRHLLCVRVVAPGGHRGALCVGERLDGGSLTDADLRIAGLLAAQAGLAFENAAQHERMREQARALEREIEERKRAQDETRTLNEELERRVEERTRDLHASQEQLRLKERLASVGTLAAGLGHDMANVLMPIRSHLQAMEALPNSDPYRPHIRAIEQCSHYLQSLTSGLRLLALDPGEEGMEHATEPEGWAAEVEPLLRNLVPRHVTLTLDVAQGLPRLTIAPHRLTQAVFNLVHNSVEALRERSEGTVRVTLRDESGGRAVRLEVEDDGAGMSETVRRRAVEPFFTTKKRGRSTGLGLSLIHGIVEACGGTLAIQSEPGRGTCVRIVLPAHRAHGGNGKTREAPVAVVSMGDERMRGVAVSLLRGHGFAVRAGAAADADAATLWLTDAVASTREEAQRFLEGGRHRRLIVTGEGGEEWRAAGAVWLGPDLRPSALRRVLSDLSREDLPTTA